MEKGGKWEEDSLEVRRSRVGNEGSSNSIESSSAATASEEEEDIAQLKGNGHMIYPSESVTVDDDYVRQESESESSVLDESKEKEKDGPEDLLLAPVVGNGGIRKETEITEEGQSQAKSNNSVYFDLNEGIWKCQVCCWTYGTSRLCSDLIQKPNGHLHQLMYCKTLSPGGPCFNFEVAEHIKQNHGDDALGITAENITDQKNLDSVVSHEQEGIQKNVDLSISQHSEISPAECVTSFSSSKVTEIETVGIDFADESDDLEGGELDVETVLQKQKTHDLYCPNCNSCITRRVILRKRKRRVRIDSEDVKRNKLETVADSKGQDIDNQTTSGQVPGTSNIHLDGTSELAANESEPDIFRCLSCFSIFIPTGKGFKFFQMFGDKGKKNMEDQPIPSTTLSDRDRTIAQSASGDTQKTSSRENVPSFNFNDLHRTAEVHSIGDKASSSTVEKQLMPGAGNASDVNTKKKDTGDYLRKPLEVSTGNQPIAPNVSNGMTFFQGDQSAAASTNRTPAHKGDSQYDPISVYQPDGLKLLIPTDVVSTTQENLQKDQKPELKIQNIQAGTESILPMPPKCSEQKDEGVHGNTTTQVEVFHEHEQHDGNHTMVPNFSAYENGTRDQAINKDGAHRYEPPEQATGKKKIEIHGEEHLKIDKDTLVLSIKEPILIHDKQADTIKDLKKMTIEQLADKDTVIVVEAGPSKTTDSQLLADSNASAELGTSPHLTTTGTDVVVEQMGADADSGEAYEFEIIKSIVYGGLVESITSLGVVSSAAGGGTATLNILALSMANLIGGLVLVAHNLWDLKKYHVMEVPNQQTRNIDRYKELLGRRENFAVHATVAVLSFIIFGLISPITYAFSFQKSDDRDFKIFASAAASLLCIVLLGTGKAYVRKPPKSYLKTLGYYVLLGLATSGISYAAGELIRRLLAKFHVLQSNSSFPISFTNTLPDASLWASY